MAAAAAAAARGRRPRPRPRSRSRQPRRRRCLLNSFFVRSFVRCHPSVHPVVPPCLWVCVSRYCVHVCVPGPAPRRATSKKQRATPRTVTSVLLSPAVAQLRSPTRRMAISTHLYTSLSRGGQPFSRLRPTATLATLSIHPSIHPSRQPANRHDRHDRHDRHARPCLTSNSLSHPPTQPLEPVPAATLPNTPLRNATQRYSTLLHASQRARRYPCVYYPPVPLLFHLHPAPDLT